MKKAAFILAHLGDGMFAATTRAKDRGEEGKIGLPGGKVEDGENVRDAAVRESSEEGWTMVGVERVPFIVQIIDGFEVSWFKAKDAILNPDHKEKGRIEPIEASLQQIIDSGYGNDVAVEFLKNHGRI